MRQGPADALGLAFEPLENLRIGQMAAIPGEQIIGGNGGGNGQVNRVARSLGRQTARREEEAGELLGVRTGRHAWDLRPVHARILSQWDTMQ